MNNLDSNCFFHFTPVMWNLYDILRNGFAPNYSLELIKLDRTNVIAGIWIPMVCFCDLPLKFLKDHMDYYGNFGLGLRKSWGIEMKMNPVLYFHDNSSLFNHIFDAMKLLENAHTTNWIDIKSITQGILGYLKPYRGISTRNLSEEKTFYNEREWRYIPDVINKMSAIPFNKRDINQQRKSFNTRIHHYQYNRLRLNINPDDIKYIIIKDEKHKSTMVNHLADIYKKPSDANLINMLEEKIISKTEILNSSS